MNVIFPLVIIFLLAYGFAVGVPKANAQTATTASINGMHVSDGSITGSEITSDTATWPGDDKLWNVCAAVALAEGFNNSTAAPYLLNNPGDLSPGDEDGQAVAGPAQQHGGSKVIHFASCEGGWTALRTKFEHIVNGTSHVYPETATWLQVAQLYAGDWQNWLNNVTNYLGVDQSSTPADYVNG
jgi:hypothetical protein